MSGGAGRRSTLPGFGLTMGLTLTWLSVIILIPLAGLFLKTSELKRAFLKRLAVAVEAHRQFHGGFVLC